jgi:hypothetical protein
VREMTESALLDDTDATASMIVRLKELGERIALSSRCTLAWPATCSRDRSTRMGPGAASTPGRARRAPETGEGIPPAVSSRVVALQSFIARHRWLLRAVWLVAVLVLAACQPDGNGAGGDGY